MRERYARMTGRKAKSKLLDEFIKRMKDMLSIWVNYLKTTNAIKTQLEKISAASINRLLKDFKVSAGKKVG